MALTFRPAWQASWSAPISWWVTMAWRAPSGWCNKRSRYASFTNTLVRPAGGFAGGADARGETAHRGEGQGREARRRNDDRHLVRLRRQQPAGDRETLRGRS